ncbi:hypothetical protein PCE1_001352 [Barthelona sp. PCE]
MGRKNNRNRNKNKKNKRNNRNNNMNGQNQNNTPDVAVEEPVVGEETVETPVEVNSEAEASAKAEVEAVEVEIQQNVEEAPQKEEVNVTETQEQSEVETVPISESEEQTEESAPEVVEEVVEEPEPEPVVEEVVEEPEPEPVVEEVVEEPEPEPVVEEVVEEPEPEPVVEEVVEEPEPEPVAEEVVEEPEPEPVVEEVVEEPEPEPVVEEVVEEPEPEPVAEEVVEEPEPEPVVEEVVEEPEPEPVAEEVVEEPEPEPVVEEVVEEPEPEPVVEEVVEEPEPEPVVEEVVEEPEPEPVAEPIVIEEPVEDIEETIDNELIEEAITTPLLPDAAGIGTPVMTRQREFTLDEVVSPLSERRFEDELYMNDETEQEFEAALMNSLRSDVKPAQNLLACYMGGYTEEGLPVLVILGPRVRCSAADFFNLLIRQFFVLSKHPYVVLFFNSTAGQSTSLSFGEFRSFYSKLNRRTRKMIKKLYCVNPSLWTRFVLTVSRPFVSRKFWEKYTQISNTSDFSVLPDGLGLPLEYLPANDAIAGKFHVEETFELPLAQVPHYFVPAEHWPLNPNDVPVLFDKLCGWMYRNGMEKSMIFRSSIVNTHRDSMIPQLECLSLPLNEEIDPIYVSNMIHHLLRSEPNGFVNIEALLNYEPGTHEYEGLVENELSRTIVSCYFSLLKQVDLHKEKNSMSLDSMSVLVGPILCRIPEGIPETADLWKNVHAKFNAILLNEYDEFIKYLEYEGELDNEGFSQIF